MPLLQILGSMTSPLWRALLRYAVRRKQAELSSGVVRNNSFWDRLVFNRIQVRGRPSRRLWGGTASRVSSSRRL